MDEIKIMLVECDDETACVAVNGRLVFVDDPNNTDPTTSRELAERLRDALSSSVLRGETILEESRVSVQEVRASLGEEFNWEDIVKNALDKNNE